ncbi:hypothetical protein [Fusibacter ferrireducens]|uniref:Homeodomain phBC6A51-type domain-containing protein n=1 Tax=Fusibacter ferrireducens TaxID=2785058 RepID=A0ABR9ZXH3_9FIRM|nr:hypothetical protein [Fusibacter ferrireducens]MBF4695168.1 hypothetical protein [Fusibacter ferrireducens]
MKNQPFHLVLRLIFEEFDIENDYIAERLDRCPSRVRHWKSDSYPSRKLLSPLITEINKCISDYATDFQRTVFRSTLITTLKETEDDIIDTIKKHSDSADDIPKIVEYTLRSLYKNTH